MISPILDLLTPTATMSSAKQSDSGTSRDAWKREMERSQTQTWFKARRDTEERVASAKNSPIEAPRVQLLHENGTASSGAQAHRSERSPQASFVAPQPGAACRTSSVRPAGTGHGADSVAHDAVGPLRPSWLPAAPITTAPSAATGATVVQQPASYAALGMQPQHARRKEPIRLHAEWDGDQVAIWLGMDASHTDTWEQLIAKLHSWLHEQGLRAASIVCNGQSQFHITATRET